MYKFFIIIGFLLAVWAFFIEPYLLAVTTLNLENKDLKGLKVVFVGDFHVKPSQRKNLIRIVNKINEQNTDLVLCTGDFVSGHKNNRTLPIEEISKELSKIKSKYGIYTVLGNHDWWQGGEKIGNELEKNGIVVLANESASVNFNGKKLYIAGLDDLSTRTVDIAKALDKTEAPTILLTHSPDIFPFISKQENFPLTDKVVLTLAGHTHGGQVRIPLIGATIVPTDYGERYAKGLVVENGKNMFVTKGLGTSILPVRFNCLPEIVVINFI